MNVSETGNTSAAPGQDIDSAARLLRGGGVVAIPTDTLYGLAADAFNADAIERVFAIKERPDGMALPVLLSDIGQLSSVARELPEGVGALAERYWPGPLTLVLRRSPDLPLRLTAGGDTVAARVPAHPVPRELARLLRRPITGTSANVSGAADPRSLDELRLQVGGRVDCLITVGPAPAGTASTIVDLSGVDLSGETPRLIREGAIPFADIEAILNSR